MHSARKCTAATKIKCFKCFECTKSPLHLTVTSLPQRLVREETVFWKSIYVCQAKDMLIEVFRAELGVIDGELVGPKAIIRSYWGSLQRKVGI